MKMTVVAVLVVERSIGADKLQVTIKCHNLPQKVTNLYCNCHPSRVMFALHPKEDRRLGLMRLTADSASCNHDFCCCPRRSVLENPVTQKQPKECDWLPKLRHYNTFGSERLKMARESDFNWEDDLMTKWVIFFFGESGMVEGSDLFV